MDGLTSQNKMSVDGEGNTGESTRKKVMLESLPESRKEELSG